jgi:hypothetical protein
LALAAFTSQILLLTRALQFSTYIYLFFSLALLIFLMPDEKPSRNKILLLIISAGLVLGMYFAVDRSAVDYMFLLVHLVILARLLKFFILESINKSVMNLFFLILVIYELTLVLRGIYNLINITPSITYNILSIIMENVFGLFFCIFSEANTILLINFGMRGGEEK